MMTLATKNNLDEVEQLYYAINDHLAENINYCGWERDAYPTRQTAEEALKEVSLV